MTGDIGTRRIVVLLVLAIVLLAATVLPGPRARLEINVAQASLLVEAGPLRVQALVSSGLPRPATLALAIGGVAR